MTHTTGDGAGLLRAICENPEEDTPRLVYADWLDEHAEAESDRARAEFIRIQVAEQAKPVTWAVTRPWTPREDELHKAHHETWRAELPTYPGITIGTSDKRGFPYYAFANSVRSYLRAAPDLFTRIPVVEVRFGGFTPRTAKDLARSPWVSRIQFLDKSDGLGGVVLAALAASPHLGNLRRTRIAYAVTGEEVRPFLANPSLTGLRDFRFSLGRRHESWLVGALASCPSAAALEEVELSGIGLRSDAAPHLPALVRLPNLRHLNLKAFPIGDEGFLAIGGTTATPAIPRVRRKLQLDPEGVTERGVAAFLTGPFLRDSDWTLVLGTKNTLPDTLKADLKAAFGDRVVV